jgi:hypothetical protein
MPTRLNGSLVFQEKDHCNPRPTDDRFLALNRSFSGPILKGMSGRRPVVKGLVEGLRTLRVRSCLRPVGAETSVSLALMLVCMALRPISKTRS